MTRSRQWLRSIAFLAVALVLLTAAIRGTRGWWPRRAAFATPADCLDAYYEAVQAADARRYLSCFADPLRSEIQQRYAGAADLAQTLQQSAVKNWVQDGEPAYQGRPPAQAQLPEPAIDRVGSVAHVNVDEVRTAGVQRVRFRLERFLHGWLITGIDRLPEKSPLVPYGTDVRDAPQESPPHAPAAAGEPKREW